MMFHVLIGVGGGAASRGSGIRGRGAGAAFAALLDSFERVFAAFAAANLDVIAVPSRSRQTGLCPW
jgi:hypothetical protein